MRIAIATTTNTRSLADLLCELYEYYNTEEKADRTAILYHLQTNLLSAKSEICLVIAVDPDDSILGLAAIHFVHSIVDPTPEGRKQCVLKELFVCKNHRSRKIGYELMIWVSKHALENGCGRLDWNVKATNSSGISFYQKLGSELVKDRISFRLTQPAIMALANGLQQQ